MRKWQYVVGAMGTNWDIETEQAQLNAMGEQGFELVSTVIKPDPSKSHRHLCFHYFKREKLDSSKRFEEERVTKVFQK